MKEWSAGKDMMLKTKLEWGFLSQHTGKVQQTQETSFFESVRDPLPALSFHLVVFVFSKKPVFVFFVFLNRVCLSSFLPSVSCQNWSPFVKGTQFTFVWSPSKSPYCCAERIDVYPVRSEREFFLPIINLGGRDLHQPTDPLIYLERWGEEKKQLHFLLKRKIGPP